jgi:hypothetical protein
MEREKPMPGRRKIVVVGLSIAYTAILMIVVGLIPRWQQWYSDSPQLRRQAASLFRGQLALSDDPRDLGHDLCWSAGGVHQVWGLGIPLWQLPFQTIAELCGQFTFPDRIALGLFLALGCYAVLRTISLSPVQTANSGLLFSTIRKTGAVFVLLMFPPFLTLLSSRCAVWEEVMIYGYVYGLLLASGVIALVMTPTWRRFYVLCSLAGAGALIRPTLMFYGISTVAVSLVVMRRHLDANSRSLDVRNATVRLLAGATLILCGGAILWSTNLLRFGDGFEFGHKLNLQRGSLLGSVYATRFDHPFQNESLWTAARELFGALFLVKTLPGTEWYAHGIFSGQSDAVRWREFYFTTYDLSYLALLVSGWTFGVLKATRRSQTGILLDDRAKPADCAAPDRIPIEWVLALWSIIASGLLAIFYLRTPAISSRYMMDFAAAFAVSIVLAWWGMIDAVHRWTIHARFTDTHGATSRSVRGIAACLFLTLGLLIWITHGIGYSKSVYGSPHSISWREVNDWRALKKVRPNITPLPDGYMQSDDLERWAIPFNGAGWSDDGGVDAAVILFVDSPEFLELEVTEAAFVNTIAADPHYIRAKIGLEFLTQEAIERKEEGWRVRFSPPRRSDYKQGIQPVFIAAVPADHITDSRTPWIMKKVTWRTKSSDTSASARLGN